MLLVNTIYTNVFENLSDYIILYAHFFSEQASHDVEIIEKIKYRIDLKSNIQFSFIFIYNLSAIELEFLWKYINKMLNKKWIQSFKSSIEVSILFVSKKNDSLYFYIDYCDINWIMIKNHYFLSLISEMLDWLLNVKIFFKFNMCDIYTWVYIKSENM